MDSPVKLFCYITSPPVSSLETLISDPILVRVLRGREEVWNWSGWPRVSQLSPAKVMGCVMKNEMSKHQDSTSDQKQPWGIYKECILALAGVAQLIGHRPANLQRSQVQFLGCEFGPGCGVYERQLIDVSLPRFLPSFLSL